MILKCINASIAFTLCLGSTTCLYSANAMNENKDTGLHLNWLDTRISPADDFYGYANGSWQKNNPIPSDYASWDSFSLLREKVQYRIRQLLEKAEADHKAKPGSIEQKIGDFYYSGMDEKSINEAGIAPLKPEFARIDKIKTKDDLQKEIVHLHQMGINALFAFGSMTDFKNSDQVIAAAFQGGLGLPDRDYYLNDKESFKKIRQQYQQHLTRMFELLGDTPLQAETSAKTVMTIETELAKASLPLTKARDPNAIYHIKTLTQLDQLTPNFSWKNYLKNLKLNQTTSLNLAMPDFFSKMDHLLNAVSIDEWKIYLRWQLIDAFASYLSKQFVDQNFKMNRVLTGTEKMLPRWKRVVNTESAALGFALGKIYVQHYFSAQDKQQVIAILNNIRTVLEQDLETLSWMSPENRKKALKKLALMQERIGYPEKWLDYSSLVINRGPYVENIIRVNQFLTKRDLDKIGKPVDKSEWVMTPQTVNAYYDVSLNNINIPAGILQAPFFDPKAPAAVNYGGIGFVMGHEITHGFDDQGSKFDGYGNLNNWWSAGDLTAFKKATHCIAEQYSRFTVNDGLHLKGQLVVGEATADLGGLTLAYKAFQQSNDYKLAKTIKRITPAQQFFISAAHIWAKNIRPEQMQHQVTTDPHPPSHYRVNGSFANMAQFQEAFHLSENSPMVNKNRCVIW